MRTSSSPAELIPFAVGKILPALLRLIVLSVAARLFAPSELGLYVIIAVTVYLLQRMGGTCLTSNAVRFLPQCRTPRDLQNFFALFWLFLAGFTLLASLPAAVFVIPMNLLGLSMFEKHLAHLGIWLFLSSTCQQAFLAVLLADRQVTKYTFFEVAHALINSMLTLFFILRLKMDVSALLWGSLLSSLAAALGLLAVLSRRYPLWGGKISPEAAKTQLCYGFPLVLAGLAIWVLGVSDRYLLRILRDVSEVGIYHLGCLLPESTFLLMGEIFRLSLRPRAIHLYEEKGIEAVDKLQQQITRLFLALSLPIALFFSLAPKTLMAFLAGPAYQAGAFAVPWVTWGALFFQLHQLAFTGLLLNYQTARLAANLAATALVNILLNFILIPRWGFVGAAVSTALSFAGLLLMTLVATRSSLPFRIGMKDMIVIISGGAAMVATMGFLQSLSFFSLPRVIFAAFGGFTAYVLVLACFLQRKYVASFF